jgi:hypothetical protein
VTLKKDEVEQQVASLLSVMLERLLDPFTKQEIADLFCLPGIRTGHAMPLSVGRM